MNIGQSVWYVPQRGYGKSAPGCEYTIIKIARKWITMAESVEDYAWNHLRVDRDQIDSSPCGYNAYDKRNDFVGKVYVDRQHESYVKDRETAWRKLSRAFDTTCPNHVTLINIKQMARIMEVELSEPDSV